jgi:hypothetical protein
MSGLNIRYVYLYEGEVFICKTNQPIQSNNFSTNLKSYLLNQSKYKLSKRYVYLFDGILIFVKKQNNLIGSRDNGKIYKFKQAITLDKCYLNDRDDDLAFELQVFNNGMVISNSNMSINSDLGKDFTNMSNYNLSNLNNPNLSNTIENEYILFLTNSTMDKYHWMSMLCYAQYKFSIDRLLQTMTEEHNRNNPLPIPPKNYIFDEPDSPETILFEQPINSFNQQQSKLDNNFNPYLSSEGLAIKAATLLKLIERLTHHLYLHPKFSSTFLMFFREFCTPKQLLDLLSIRYDVPDLNLVEIESRYNFNR